MALPISDAVAVDVLRRIDRLATPLVHRLTRNGTTPARRERWWAQQVPVAAAAISAAPRFAGKLADLLPLQNAVGGAVQCVVVLGVATDSGLTAPEARVALLARVVLDRRLPPERVRPLLRPARSAYLDTALGRDAGRGGVLRTVWRASRLLSRIDDALDARPKGKLRHRALANLPVVGVVGGYAAEREGLRRAACAGLRLAADPAFTPAACAPGAGAAAGAGAGVAADRAGG